MTPEYGHILTCVLHFIFRITNSLCSPIGLDSMKSVPSSTSLCDCDRKKAL